MELETYIRARYPILWVVTPEEKRALAAIDALAQRMQRRLLYWSITTGESNPALPADPSDRSRRDPITMLNAILAADHPGIWVLRDFHPLLKDVNVVRRMREIAFGLHHSKKTVILLGPVLAIPPELEKEITVVDYPLPSAAELNALVSQIEETAGAQEAIQVELNRRGRDRLVRACQGLTIVEAENAVAKAIIESGGRLDERSVDAVTAEKQQIIRKSGLLEFYASQEQMDNVGGLETLKEWLRKRVRAFSESARAFGLPEPKGILLVGVQGCGKSLVAKSVATAWRLPLLRLDVGRLFASLVGSSEENLRNAIRVAESIAPVVLWVDEIEKGFSGVGSSNVSDAGTSARVFGSFITWLQEKQAPVFVIATANDVSQLPPELVRKGRFDEIFFVDLPSATERAEIWRIHLLKRNRNPDSFDLNTLAMASDGLSGAEIEQAVVDALYEAFDQNRPLHMNDLLTVLQQTIPLSTMMEEQIRGLRSWAQQRARAASG